MKSWRIGCMITSIMIARTHKENWQVINKSIYHSIHRRQHTKLSTTIFVVPFNMIEGMARDVVPAFYHVESACIGRKLIIQQLIEVDILHNGGDVLTIHIYSVIFCLIKQPVPKKLLRQQPTIQQTMGVMFPFTYIVSANNNHHGEWMNMLWVFDIFDITTQSSHIKTQ